MLGLEPGISGVRSDTLPTEPQPLLYVVTDIPNLLTLSKPILNSKDVDTGAEEFS